MEKFLVFWSHNNAVIIEILVALILVSTIYMVYRTFFGSKEVDTFNTSAGAGVNTVQIEKTLQKILEQQSSKAVAAAGASSSAGSPPAELVQELSTMRKALEEKEKQIVILQDKAVAAAKAAQSENPPPSADAIAAAAQAAAGLAEKERLDYEAKIKELEARLAEYEIISEDIADLSFFKEENARLTKELEALRSGAPAASVAAAPPAPAAPTPVVESAPPPEPAPEPVVAAPTLEEPPALTSEPPAVAAAGTDVIDDSLMAEFAKAVEGQKASTEATPKKDENEKLMAEFDNATKKS